MNLFYKKTAAAVLTVVMLAGCSAAPAPTQSGAAPQAMGADMQKRSVETDSSQPREADPEGAIQKIYETITIKELHDADDTTAVDVIGLDLEKVEAYYIRYADGRFGLSDVYIVKPAEGQLEAVTKALTDRRDSRVREFENFNILDAQAISKNAVIYDQGGYVIMLMLADNEAGRAIIDQYIPDEL